MAAVTAAVEPEESRVMFSRWFTSCFQARQERSALSSKDSLHPAEGFSETESGASTAHIQHSTPTPLPQPLPQPPQLQPQPTLSAAQPETVPRTKDPDMPKAPSRKVTKTATAAAKLGLTARPKKKSVFGFAMHFWLSLLAGLLSGTADTALAQIPQCGRAR